MIIKSGLKKYTALVPSKSCLEFGRTYFYEFMIRLSFLDSQSRRQP